MSFVLHPRLEADSLPLLELVLSSVRVMNDRRFPWLLLVPRRAGIEELVELARADRAALIEEIARAAGALRRATPCDKINIAALGNVVRQLHVHVVARRAGDAAWPSPVWGHGQAESYREDEIAAFAARLLATFGMDAP